MRKLCAAITAIGVTAVISLAQAEGITGIYSCSSGVNNDRPVTYMFNLDLMVRDNEKDAPFEFVTGLNSGKLLYIGRGNTKYFDQAARKWGFGPGLETWMRSALPDLEGRILAGEIEETDEIVVLHRAAGCLMGIRTSSEALEDTLFLTKKQGNYDPKEQLPSEKRCENALQTIESLGISDPILEVRRRNFAKAPKDEIFDTLIVTVDLSSSKIFEATIDKPELTEEYNCTVLDIDVPKIEPPENAIKAST